MIDDKTEATTAQICALADLSKQRLSQLEGAGIIRRAGKDRWPLVATMRALFIDARARSAAHSEAKGRMELARAKALELKLAREEGKVAPLQEWNDAMVIVTGNVLTGLNAIPPRFTRDLAERRRLEGLINEMRTDVSQWLLDEADRLEEEARKSARRRL
jgi:phage terminase Nu1 subunit (DNA packaging protein)